MSFYCFRGLSQNFLVFFQLDCKQWQLIEIGCFWCYHSLIGSQVFCQRLSATHRKNPSSNQNTFWIVWKDGKDILLKRHSLDIKVPSQASRPMIHPGQNCPDRNKNCCNNVVIIFTTCTPPTVSSQPGQG